MITLRPLSPGTEQDAYDGLADTVVDWTSERTGRHEWGRSGRTYTYAGKLQPGDRLPGGFTVTGVRHDGRDVLIEWRADSGETGSALRCFTTEQELLSAAVRQGEG